MNKWVSFLAMFVCLSAAAFCDSPLLQSYKQNFSKADISVKAEILKDAASERTAPEFIAQLYEYALQFALDNSELLKDDPDMINLVDIAVKGIRNAGISAASADGSECLDTIWRLFVEYPDSAIGAEILVTMGKLGKGNETVIANINNFLSQQTDVFGSGMSVNYAMVSACIDAILELKDSSSYQVLFGVLCAGYPEVITYEASGALDLIPGNFKQFLFDIIEKNPPEEKYIAFKTGSGSRRLNVSERGQLAELALEQGLISNGGDDADLTAMRYAAVLALTSLRWTRANALAIRHYYRVQTDYQHNTASKERFIEAIACLGAVGNSDAALALILQLGLINARTARTGSYDPEITQAIVQALGRIGDKAAFDQLLDVRNLSYPENIQTSAKEAIDRLRW